MKGRLPASASVALPSQGGKLCAPSAERNVASLVSLLQKYGPKHGRALEIASGTGQHIIAFAKAFPHVHWQPTEPDRSRRASIQAYCDDATVTNISPPLHLDATAPGWGAAQNPLDLIILVNLLHLISTSQVKTLILLAAQALAPAGKLVLYGPFKRDGNLTSEGDVQFDAELRLADPHIGYKDDLDILSWLGDADLTHHVIEAMPANNLAIIAQKP